MELVQFSKYHLHKAKCPLSAQGVEHIPHTHTHFVLILVFAGPASSDPSLAPVQKTVQDRNLILV